MNVPLRKGNLVIPEPCAMVWEDMQKVGNAQRFRTSSNHTIVDFSVMTENEILRPIRHQSGKVCGSLRLDTNGAGSKAAQNEFKAVFLRQILALASLLLLVAPLIAQVDGATLQHSVAMEASHFPANNVNASSKTNTLVTGIVTTGHGRSIPDEVDVRIYLEGEQIVKVKTREGLFFVDLKGNALPEDRIEVVVWKDNSLPQYSHKGKTIRTTVGEGQNLSIRLVYEFADEAYPPRRDGRTLYDQEDI